MKNKLYSGKARIFVWLAIFVAVLVLVGVLMHVKLRSLMRGHIERQVAAEVKILAQVTESELESELEKLEYISGMLENKEDAMKQLFAMVRNENDKSSMGILELDGTVLCGDALETAGYAGVREAFRGNRGISYKKGDGMLFTVPIYHNGNVKYVLYQLMEEELLSDRFEVSYYDGKGKVLLATGEEEIVFPYEEWNQAELDFLQSEAAEESFAKIREKMIIATEAATFCEKAIPQYLFVAEVGEYDFLIAGAVDEETAAEGIFVIITLVFWVFGLLLLLLAIGMAFLFGAQEKAKESEDLRRAKEMADTANRAKSDFLASMSHEIRTPINAVMGMNEMIIRECREDEIKEYAYNIQNAGKTLLTLINDILDLSKIEAGKMEIIKERYFLSSLLNGVVNMIQVKANQKNLDFYVDVDETIPDELYGDEIRIRQVMVNLLNNAVKYTRRGTVWLRIEKEDAQEGAIRLKITVQDTGIGIKEEDMGRLFNGFERLDTKENRNVEGTGLGLAITSRIIELMHGELKVESVYGEGSAFTAIFPQKVIRPGGIGDFEEKYHAYIQSLQTYRESFRAPEAEILVVDDNDMNLFVFENLLKKTQVKITKCTSGEACLELVCAKKFDVIFLDHMMPGMDGIETMKQMREMEDFPSKKAPVIALTANAIVGVREMYIGEGFDDYLSKPIVGDDLEEMLRRYIPRRKLIIECKEEKTDTEVAEPVLTKEDALEEFLDRQVGLQYCCGDDGFYKEMLNAYLDNDKHAAICEYYKEGDWEQYRILVHALKSTSLSIGAVRLSEAAKELEMAAKENRIEVIHDKHATVMEDYARLLFLLRGEAQGQLQEKAELSAGEEEKAQILVVDDDRMNLKSAERMLNDRFDIVCVTSGQEALDYMERNCPDLVLLDLHMPEMNGFEVIRKMKEQSALQDIPVIFLTADNDSESEIRGFREGALDFIKKPFIADIMLQRIHRILDLDRLQKNLQMEVEKQTRNAERRREKVERLSLQIMLTLAETIDAKDKYTNGHSVRVAEYAREIAKRAGKSEQEQEDIYYIGLLHDIGKIGIPNNIINKKSGLTEEEYAIMKDHPRIGADILGTMTEIPGLSVGAHWHHELYNGAGYPDGLTGEEIPEIARIIGVSDAYDAMTSKRSYRDVMPQEVVKEELRKGSGTQFDPRFAEIMLQMMEEDKEYRLCARDI